MTHEACGAGGLGPAPRHPRVGGDRFTGLQLRQLPAGPDGLDEREPDALASARFGPHEVTAQDIVVGADDGVLFVTAGRAAEVLATAHEIWRTEREQARRIRSGQSLRQQTVFEDYLAQRAADPSYTFRQHLRRIGGAIEE